MQRVLNLYKPVGMTPLQLIRKFQQQNPTYASEKLGYAGRLDPMAEGVLLILVGEENKKRKSYEDLAKTYDFRVLFGLETDTYDVLGKIISTSDKVIKHEDLQKNILEFIPTLIGQYDQPYPPYSSKHIEGKALYYWAREDKLDQITIPTKSVEVDDLSLLTITTIPRNALIKLIASRINNVSGEFRQELIYELWQHYFSQQTVFEYPVAHFSLKCSSGTYVRSIAHILGEKMQTGGIALSILRTSIGEYTFSDAEHI